MSKDTFSRKFINRVLGVDLRTFKRDNQELQEKLNRFTPEVLARLRDMEIKQIHLEDRLIKLSDLLKSDRDNIASLRNKLFEVRQTKEYELVLKNKTPLVTIRIAT